MNTTLCQSETTLKPLKTSENKIGCDKSGSTINTSNQSVKENENLRQRKDKFLRQATELHRNKYDYSLVDYMNNRQDVIIICSLHGQFYQRPDHHLSNSGCPKCGVIKSNSDRTKSQSDFISSALRIHKKKYDYSKVVYKGAFRQVIIICPKHFEFLQTPDHHLRGCGCSKCIPRVSKVETDFLDYLGVPYYNRQMFISKYGFHVDGLDPKNNIVYEFLGDYYHGNPEKFDPNGYNKICHKTHKSLYYETMERFAKLKSIGYQVKYVWENDWRKFRNGKVKYPKIQSHKSP